MTASTPIPVVHAVPGAWLPQTQTWLHDQVRFLPPSVTSHIVCGSRANDGQFGLPNVHVGPYSRARWRRARPILASTIRATGAELVHSHFATEGWRNRRAAGGVAHVVSFYGYDVNQLPSRHPRWRGRYRQLFADVDRVLCEGEHMAQCIVALGCPEAKMHVQRLGVDLSTLPFTPRSWSSGAPLRVLLAAGFRAKKGLPLAIEALGRIRGEVELAVTIVGDASAAPESQAEKQRILAALDRTELADRTERLGMRPYAELLDIARDHHLFVAPSVTAADGDTEGGAPVTIIDLAASGMPIVSSRHCDIPGVIRHGETGFLAQEGDVDDLTAQLRAAIAAAPHWGPMLEAGRRWIESRFDAARQGEALAAVYADVLAARAAPRRRAA
jgi:colanic acid/amylovoran biosynthesis glycosyltransferase